MAYGERISEVKTAADDCTRLGVNLALPISELYLGHLYNVEQKSRKPIS